MRMRSPSSSFMIELTCSINASILYSIRFVEPLCFVTPLILYHSSRLCGSLMSFAAMKSVTGLKNAPPSALSPQIYPNSRKGGTNQNVSKPLAALHGSPFFFAASWTFRPV